MQKVKSAATLSEFKPSNLNVEEEKEGNTRSEKEIEIMRESQFTDEKSPTAVFRLEGSKINFDSAVNSTLRHANATKGLDSSKN